MGFFDIFKKKKVEESNEVVAAPEVAQQIEQEELNTGLEKTKEGFFSKLHRAVAGRSTVDMDLLDDLEEALITSDVGVDTTVKIIRKIEERVARDKYVNSEELYSMLYDEIALLMEQAEGSAENFGLDAKE
jgi:fused signal recognition particle receptor